MKCPTCKKAIDTAATNPFRPFCSARCKMVDLGRWVSGDYRVPTQERPTESPPKPNGHLEEEDGD